jgi:hypothetical protein
MKASELTGQVFGRLTVRMRGPNTTGGKTTWECVCVCGTLRTVSSNHLKNGHTKSCGCFNREVAAKRASKIKHGMCDNPTYSIWSNMKTRCLNSKDLRYPGYGGRGITICGRWLKFENFYADMGKRPTGMSIDRINNNGNYEPGNCRWATSKEQAQNRRNSLSITYLGETKAISEWAKLFGIKYGTIKWRLKKGWPVEKILTLKKEERNESH